MRSNADGFDSMAEKVSNFGVVKTIKYARQQYLCKSFLAAVSSMLVHFRGISNHHHDQFGSETIPESVRSQTASEKKITESLFIAILDFIIFSSISLK